MSDIVIRVENLSKQYRIGGPQGRYKTIRESLTEAVQAPFRRLSSVVRGQSSAVSNETIWALKDVSFEVKRGEVVGIIGRNGAGKTTLLKVLSRITEPTEGYAEIYGRVGSLLEVGTGFHPELTGRENIYLNGAILGMKKAEVEGKFDEIVDFADVEKFIDTPVKHYSSGMYVRLAFAVAAHLEPEILLVDEVLAVGDVAFQRKSLGKMKDVTEEGRTVLFVSHNMASIEQLCDRAILLQAGNLVLSGDPYSVIRHYLTQTNSDVMQASVDLAKHPGRVRGAKPVFEKVRLLGQDNQETVLFPVGDDLVVEVVLDTGEIAYDSNAFLAILIDNERGQRICQFRTDYQLGESLSFSGKQLITCTWPKCYLGPNRYNITLVLKSDMRVVDRVEQAIKFEITPGNIYGTGKIDASMRSFLWPRGEWNISSESEVSL
jgi:lipopolysaccharide transport system ATP-binding protein